MRAGLPRRNPSSARRRGSAQALRRLPQRLALVCAARQDHQLRIREGGRGKALRGLAEGNGEDLCRVYESPRKGPAPAHAGRRYVGLSARHQPPGAHHPARKALWRRLQRRRGPHQLCRRLHARLSARREGGRRRLLRSRSRGQAKGRNLPAHPLLATGSGRAPGQGRVLSHLGQAYQVRHLRRICFGCRQSPASPPDFVRRNPP